MSPADSKIEKTYFPMKEKEKVDHPAHYNKGIEVIDFIESWDMNFSAGNAIKYIVRHELKGEPMEDLKKAKWYVERLIQNLEGAQN
tara:strand:- start:289 stop:546 length:258 start_codon:yes stop_codon:yes gene_type:complete